MFKCPLHLATPITGLTPGQCHWLEVSSETWGEGDRPTACYWHWAVKDSTIGAGGYSFTGTCQDWPELDQSVYAPGGERAFDLAFCADCGLDPAGCAEPTRTCCSCYDDDPPSTCTVDTYGHCLDRGVWDVEAESCVDYACSDGPPPGDTCENAVEITDGSHSFNTRCADTNGPATINAESGPISFGNEVFYRYVATCTCVLQVSMCTTGHNYDSLVETPFSVKSPPLAIAPGRFFGAFLAFYERINYNSALALYHNENNPGQCPCPGDPGFQQDGLGSDEGCNGIRDAGAGFLMRNIFPGDCWLIAVGGVNDEGGGGTLDVQFIHCDLPIAEPPVAEQTVPDVGFGTRNRYLSFSVTEQPYTSAIRLTLRDLPPPFETFNAKRMWIGEPFKVTESSGDSGPSPDPAFWAATLQCDPYYTDWAQYGSVHVFHELIIPGGSYDLQAIHGPYCTITSLPVACTGRAHHAGNRGGA